MCNMGEIMPLHGQASGGWTESSSALRILNPAIRNSLGVLTDDAFTQANPVAVATGVSTRLDTTKIGILSGSVCFTRPISGNNYVGGPGTSAIQVTYQADAYKALYRPLGVFINSASGNPYENTPAVASGVGPYVSGMGTYASALYETDLIFAVAGNAAGTDLVYATGNQLVASRNGFLMPKWQVLPIGGFASIDTTDVGAESFVLAAANSGTIIGIVKMAPDAFQTEVVWDQRI
jgi:hypothetical protein